MSGVAVLEDYKARKRAEMEQVALTQRESCNVDEAVEALFAIPTDRASLTYDGWWEVSTAARAAGINFETWDAWCMTDPDDRYRPVENRAIWNGITVDGGITAATLFHRAMQHGWTPPRQKGRSWHTSTESDDSRSKGGAIMSETTATTFEAKTVSLSAYIHENLPKPEWVIPGVIARGEVLLVTGEAGVGKTSLVNELSLAVVTGRDWLTYRCVPGNVYHVDPELTVNRGMRRMQSLCERLGVTGTDLKGDLDTCYTRVAPKDIRQITSELMACEKDYSLVVFDSVSALMPPDSDGDENSNSYVRQVFVGLQQLAEAKNCAIVVMHHSGKAVADGYRSGNIARGASVFKDGPDVVAEIVPLVAEEGSGAEALLEAYASWEYDEASGKQVRVYPKPVRLRFVKNRYTRRLPSVDMVFRHPIHIVDDTGELSECRTTYDKAAKGGAKNGERCAKLRADDNALLQVAVDEIHAEGKLATKDAAFSRFNELRVESGLEEMSATTFANALAPTSNRLDFVLNRVGRRCDWEVAPAHEDDD